MKIPRYFAEIVEEFRAQRQNGETYRNYEMALSDCLASAAFFGILVAGVYEVVVLNAVHHLSASPLLGQVSCLAAGAILMFTWFRVRKILKICSLGVKRIFLLTAIGFGAICCIGAFNAMLRFAVPSQFNLVSGLICNLLPAWLSFHYAKDARVNSALAFKHPDALDILISSF